jgi:AraC family transcriptional regulator of adaptative response / DNA-3-methyladenine glycosylase II
VKHAKLAVDDEVPADVRPLATAVSARDGRDGDAEVELDPVRCYQAVLSHDRRFDGRFFSGVVTTGIYCRPICPVSPPKLENIRWFRHAAAAEAAGFRPCMRCRPETAPGTPAWLGTSAVVSRALRLIEEGALDEACVDDLAARLGIGGRQLRRLFAEHVGASPAEVARVRRVHFARALIDETTLPLTAVAFSAGFKSVRAFNHAVRTTFRRPPRVLRAKAKSGAGATSDGALEVRLAYRPPFDWPAMLRFLALRATPGVETVDGESYRRTIAVGGEPAVVEVRHDRDAPALRMRVWLGRYDALMRLVDRARRVFDLSADPLQIATDLARDAALARRIAARPGLRIPGAWDGFELAVRAILGQQVTVGGATTLAGRLVERFGTRIDSPVAGLTHLFPLPSAVADAEVETIGLPRARATTIRAVAAAVAEGALVLDGSGDVRETMEQLRKIPGIGPWTADYVAMRALGEPDAFPSGDLGLRRALGNGAGPIAAPALARIAEAWRPWRSYAAMYLWMEG